MDYDFSGVCADQLEKLAKRLEALKKANLKEYALAMNVINQEIALDNLGGTLIQITDIFNDVSKAIQIIYTEALNKAQRKLKEHLA